MINLIVIEGNLGGDPDLRETQSGVKIASFSVACTEYWPKPDGTFDSKTIWVRCAQFGPGAENTANKLKKGQRVVVTGSLRDASAYLKDGEARASNEVKVRSVSSLARSEGNGDEQAFDEEALNALF